MIETFMFFALGFLAASLLALVVIPFVHNRAERLTMRRIKASTPLSIEEIRADKDQLRAEFAMSTRRLELNIEQLRDKTAKQLAELGRKALVVNRQKVELDAKTATISALRKRGARAPWHPAGEDEFSVKAEWLREAERTLADKEAQVTRLRPELDERSRTADCQRIEIVALKMQIDALNDQVADHGKRRALERDGPEWRGAIMRIAQFAVVGHLQGWHRGKISPR
jgi:hypothetical protein